MKIDNGNHISRFKNRGSDAFGIDFTTLSTSWTLSSNLYSADEMTTSMVDIEFSAKSISACLEIQQHVK